MYKKFILLIGLAVTTNTALWAQTEKPPVDHSYKPMILKLDEKGTKFIRFITWHQAWFSVTDNNPGTLDINGKVVKSSTDIALRRSRVLIQAQVSPRFMIVSHFGINNQNFVSGGSAGTLGTGASATGQGGKRPQLYLHDAWTEYAVKPGVLHIGTGLHYWNGISRLTNSSTLNMMTLDAPIVNWVNIDATDQFARQLGIYAKGQIGKLDYRVHLNKPFAYGVNPATIKSSIATNVLNENWATGGYLNYMVYDKESNVLPYMVGTYLGAKKVLNIGAGWYSHKGATANIKSTTDSAVVLNNQTNLGIDVYADMPLNKKKGTAINFYAVYYHNNFGNKYIRNIGILNQHASVQTTATNADASWAGGGNLQPTIGSGNVVYSHLGYLLPKLKNGTAFMPYVTFTHKSLDRIGKSSAQFDIGMNYLLNGHNAKITAQYGTRPVYKTVNGQPERNGSKGQLTVQTHIFL